MSHLVNFLPTEPDRRASAEAAAEAAEAAEVPTPVQPRPLVAVDPLAQVQPMLMQMTCEPSSSSAVSP